MTEHNRSYVPCVDVIFDGPPGPESGRFVECEDVEGRGVRAGEWIERGDGMWALRIPLGQRVTTTGPSSECGFCAAEHPSPNQPGACVMFWQGLADGYRDALHRISGLALTGDFTAAAKGDLAIDYAKTALMGK